MKRLTIIFLVALATATTLEAQRKMRTADVTSDTLMVHDPVMAYSHDTYHVFSTGRGIQHATSKDLDTTRGTNAERDTEMGARLSARFPRPRLGSRHNKIPRPLVACLQLLDIREEHLSYRTVVNTRPHTWLHLGRRGTAGLLT